ncbi:unnamed protein product, partial [Arabidopsis halleri]
RLPSPENWRASHITANTPSTLFSSLNRPMSFSYGISLWEILTGEESYVDMHRGAIIGFNFSLRIRDLYSSDKQFDVTINATKLIHTTKNMTKNTKNSHQSGTFDLIFISLTITVMSESEITMAPDSFTPWPHITGVETISNSELLFAYKIIHM